MSEDFYVELEFCASVYDYEVYLSEYIDKFARCIVNGVTSDYNSSDRGFNSESNVCFNWNTRAASILYVFFSSGINNVN